MLVKMQTQAAAGGSGIPDINLTKVYDKGTWDSVLKTNIKTYNVTEGANSIVIGSSQGSGIYINTDLSADYCGMIVVTKPSDSINFQLGICNTGATLPSIVSSGTGRHSYVYGSRYKFFSVPIISGKGVFFSATSGEIEQIYFVNND